MQEKLEKKITRWHWAWWMKNKWPTRIKKNKSLYAWILTTICNWDIPLAILKVVCSISWSWSSKIVRQKANEDVTTIHGSSIMIVIFWIFFSIKQTFKGQLISSKQKQVNLRLCCSKVEEMLVRKNYFDFVWPLVDKKKLSRGNLMQLYGMCLFLFSILKGKEKQD